MKSPDEIKKGLICRIRSFGDSCNHKCETCGFRIDNYSISSRYDDALAYIQQLEAQVPKWISVKERLPEDDVAVLVYAIGNNENSCVAMTSYTHHMYGYNIEGWRSPWQYFFYERKITHWMPLPEPPKEV